jgi:chemotaxis protein CheC
MKPDSLTEIQYDALREVGSIGAGHAATALSQLVDHRIELAMPSLDLLPVTEIPRIFGGPENLVAAVYHRILGDLSGSILFVMDRASALGLADFLRNRAKGATKSLGDAEQALVTHAASVIISAYLASVGRLADLNVLPGRPAFSFDMVGAILEVVAVDVGTWAEEALLLRTEFRSDEAETEEEIVDAYLLFLPDEASLDTLLGRLGVG